MAAKSDNVGGSSAATRGDLKRYRFASKEGWRRWVDKPSRVKPESLTSQQLTDLNEDERADYAETRADWHANILVRTSQLVAAHEQFDLIESSNRQDDSKVRGACVIDAPGGLGKTTTALTFARQLDRTQRRKKGDLTEAGHERIPVLHVRLTSSTSLRTLNKMICHYYGHPAAEKARENADELGKHAVDCVLSCETKLGFIDDLHFINPSSEDGRTVSNHLKWLANEMPITFMYAGINLDKKGYFNEDGSGPMSQNIRRWTTLELSPFRIDTEENRDAWIKLLKGVEREIVLAEAHPGMLVNISDYLYVRSTGYIESLMTLIVRGCRLATIRGTERLSEDLLDAVRIDTGAERARRELEAGFRSRKLTTKPRRRKAISGR